MNHPPRGAVLDTHAWIWFVNSPRMLSRKAEQVVSRAQSRNALYISAISVWEAALLVPSDCH